MRLFPDSKARYATICYETAFVLLQLRMALSSSNLHKTHLLYESHLLSEALGDESSLSGS
jgi:hypothetical protein